MEEQKRNKRIVKLTVQESKKTILELRDSIDPASQAGCSLKNLAPFLEQMQQKVASEHPSEVREEVRKTLAKKLADFFLIILLQPARKLLRELWAKAVMVISQILGGN